jgi:hypothetical protein
MKTNVKNFKIYLDMDSVLCDFEKKFNEYYGPVHLARGEQKELSDDWKDFIVNKNGFEKLDWYPGGQELLKYVRSTKLPVEILSSSGGIKFHGEVTSQKIKWLKSHNIDYKANIVPGRKYKSEYANHSTILIDDNEDNILNFNKAGGHGILHKNLGKTLDTLKKLLDNSTK